MVGAEAEEAVDGVFFGVVEGEVGELGFEVGEELRLSWRGRVRGRCWAGLGRCRLKQVLHGRSDVERRGRRYTRR